MYRLIPIICFLFFTSNSLIAAEVSPQPYFKPSFDCQAKLNDIETIICESELLAILDQALQIVYKAALSHSINTKVLSREQNQWLKQRVLSLKNQNKEDAEWLLAKDYDVRIQALINNQKLTSWLMKISLPIVVLRLKEQEENKIYNNNAQDLAYSYLLMTLLIKSAKTDALFSEDNRFNLQKNLFSPLNIADIFQVNKDEYIVRRRGDGGNALGCYLFLQLSLSKTGFITHPLSLPNFPNCCQEESIAPWVLICNGVQWDPKNKTLTVWDNMDNAYKYRYQDKKMLIIQQWLTTLEKD